MVERYKGIEKIPLQPNKEKIVVKLKSGELSLGSLLTLEGLAWTQGKEVLVDRGGKQYTISDLRKELQDGE
jgi:hypothetical protein